MVMRVQKIGDEYCVVLTAQAIEALHLTDGAEVEVRSAESAEVEAAPIAPEHRYVTVEEGLEAYRRTEPFHVNTYKEMAK